LLFDLAFTAIDGTVVVHLTPPGKQFSDYPLTSNFMNIVKSPFVKDEPARELSPTFIDNSLTFPGGCPQNTENAL
jgi:hypothetical protein